MFGWCSWDSFYSAVSASGLSDAVQSLSSGGTPPRWVVIDDGWQCTEARGWGAGAAGGRGAAWPCAGAARVPACSCWPLTFLLPLHPTHASCQVDEPYRDIPTEQLKQKLLREQADKARGRGRPAPWGRPGGPGSAAAAPPPHPPPPAGLPPRAHISCLPSGHPVLPPLLQLPGEAVAAREAYLEGEMEALGQAVREIPAGTAMGAYLQEIRASGEGLGGAHAGPLQRGWGTG